MTTLSEYLESRDIAYEVLPHHRAVTGIEEALLLGLKADEVLKTVILDTAGRHVALVLPSGERLDMGLVRTAVGDPDARLANEAEIEHDFFGFELGALPPIAPLLGVETIVDPTVLDHEEVIFAAGTQTESMKVRTEALFESQDVRVAQIAELWNEGRA